MNRRLFSYVGAQIAALFFFVLFQGSHLLISTGCGGSGTGSSGGDSDVEGLEIASQMSVVTPKEESSSSLSSFLQKFAVPTTGDYVTDEADIHVYAPSMEAMAEFNFILCYLDQTRYDDMVNQGPYLALVNVTACEEEEEGTEHTGESSAGDVDEWDSVVVKSIRESNDVPQTVRMWITLPPDDPWADTILGEMTIFEGRSETAPFGIFSANFVELREGNPVFSGNFSCDRNDEGLIDCGMAMEGEEEGEMRVQMTPDGSEGRAYMHFQFTDWDEGEGTEVEMEEEGRVAFDNDHFLSHFEGGHEGSEDQCFDRNSFTNHAWRYKLYTEDGSQVDRNSGLPIIYGTGEDQRYGWAGYWGIWLPEDIEIVDGMSVRRPDTDEEITVRVGNGRLMKRERSELTLDDFTGDTLKHWDDLTQIVWLVTWDGENILKIGEEICNENGCTTEDDQEGLSFEANQWFGMWKDGFGYLDLVIGEDAVPHGDQAIPFYQESFVLLDDPLLVDGDLTFQGHFNCLEAPITDSNNPFKPESLEVTDTSQPLLYTFDAETYSLFDPDGVEVTWEAPTDDGGSYSWGAMSGAMVTADTELEDPWTIWNEPLTFMYEVGPNPWNKMSMVVDSTGVPIHFEEPLHCLYRDELEGTFYLNYEGVGELHGIPGVEGDDGRWTPLITIADGSELNCDGTLYYARAMEIEQMMDEDDMSECASLSIEDIGPPTNEIGEVDIGPQPELTSDDPAVIAGELQ